MSARSGGSFATLLMTVPLAAIPLMAVFGVPQFTSVSASTEPQSEDIRRHPSTVLGVGDGQLDEGGGSQPDTQANDFLFSTPPQSRPSTGGAPRPLTRPSIVQAPPRGRTSVSPQPRAPASPAPQPTALATSAADSSKAAPVRAPLSRARRPQAGSVPTPPAKQHAEGLSWQQAAQRLQQWGIEDYRLERGHESGSFLFVCQFAPGGDPRIVRRFEAENTEPLRAVQEVFARIDDWQQVTQSITAEPR